jgi:hypothetical protein
MYRDKTRRKRGALGPGEDAVDEVAPHPAAPASAQSVSDVDLKRSATGLL